MLNEVFEGKKLLRSAEYLEYRLEFLIIISCVFSLLTRFRQLKRQFEDFRLQDHDRIPYAQAVQIDNLAGVVELVYFVEGLPSNVESYLLFHLHQVLVSQLILRFGVLLALQVLVVCLLE